LAEDYIYNSPYAFSENHVTSHVELEGLEKVSIHSRSFIPYKTLGPFGEGGSYSGDNRGFGDEGKSRMEASVGLNLSGSRITKTDHSFVGADTFDSEGNLITHSEADGTINFGSNQQADGTSATTDLEFHVFANNDAIPGSPDIDVKGRLQIGVVENEDGSSTGMVSGRISGDRFPANETFLTDRSGSRIFLGVSGADGFPLISLPGNNNRNMSKFSISINFDKSGNATGVNYNGTNYSIDDWNKQFTNQNSIGDVNSDYR